MIAIDDYGGGGGYGGGGFGGGGYGDDGYGYGDGDGDDGYGDGDGDGNVGNVGNSPAPPVHLGEDVIASPIIDDLLIPDTEPSA